MKPPGPLAFRAALAFALVMSGCLALRAQPQMVGLLVEPFAGVEPLGRKVATILHLQVWQTLRQAPPNNRYKLHFGRGIVYWDEGNPPTNHDDAVKRLAGTEAQMVLWGRAQQFGEGVVVQAYLSIGTPPDGPGGAGTLWSVALPELEGSRGAIGVGLPSSLIEFGPIVLRREVIPLLNTPAGLPIYKDTTFREKVGALGPDFRGVEQGADVAKVQSGGVQGWVRLPGLSANRSEVTDFSGALLRMYRKDWGGAIDLFSRVTNTPNVPVNVSVSSYLLMAAASRFLHDQIGAPDRSLELIAAAERLNPYLRETIKYKCLALLARPRTEATVRQLDETIRRGEYLFPKDDPWMGKVKAVVARARPR